MYAYWNDPLGHLRGKQTFGAPHKLREAGFKEELLADYVKRGSVRAHTDNDSWKRDASHGVQDPLQQPQHQPIRVNRMLLAICCAIGAVSSRRVPDRDCCAHVASDRCIRAAETRYTSLYATM